MADDTKNLEISITDKEIEEVETGRTKQATNKLDAMRREIKKAEADLKAKKEKLKTMEDAAKERKARTRGLCIIGGDIVNISGKTWQELSAKNGVAAWITEIKAEAVKKYQAAHPAPDIDRIKAATPTIRPVANPAPATTANPVRPTPGAGMAIEPKQPQSNLMSRPSISGAGVVRSMAAGPH